MITGNINFEGFDRIYKKLLFLKSDLPAISKELSTSMIAIIRERIHVQGKASDGSNIGDYDPEYEKLREKRGRKEGGKVVLSFNRNLENSYAIIQGDNGLYGIGILNGEILKVVGYLEAKYQKKIYSLTDEEKKLVFDFIQHKVEEDLKANA